MGGCSLIRGHLKARAAIAIGMAALLIFGLIGCLAQESPTATPSDIPTFSEEEAIAVVQTLLVQGGCLQLNVGAGEWNGKYSGDGKWTVTSKGGIISGEWTVFERTGSVRIVKPSFGGC